jgi:D-alanine-D-alanine ligase-like ATP-grasp enzyme
LTEPIDEWEPYDLSKKDQENIAGFMRYLGCDWGRLDFMLDANGVLVFLEYNANGQFVFLDFANKIGLLECVGKYLST